MKFVLDGRDQFPWNPKILETDKQVSESLRNIDQNSSQLFL